MVKKILVDAHPDYGSFQFRKKGGGYIKTFGDAHGDISSQVKAEHGPDTEIEERWKRFAWRGQHPYSGGR